MARRSLRSSVPTRHTTGIERPRCVDRLPSHNSKTVVSTVRDGGPRRPLCHHQADPSIRSRRPAAQQYGLVAAALSRLPRLRRRPCGPGGGGRVSERQLRGRRCRAGRFSFEVLLRQLASSMGVRGWFLHTPPRVGLALTWLVGLLMRDMALTHEEVVGLMAGLLTSDEPPTGTTRLADWMAENGDGLGRRYVSELRRNWRL